MSRTFNENQLDVLLNTFGESINVNGTEIVVIFEQEVIVLDGADGLIQSEEHYFSTKQGSVKLNDLFTYNYKNYQVFSISDDLSGIINCYFREV